MAKVYNIRQGLEKAQLLSRKGNIHPQLGKKINVPIVKKKAIGPKNVPRREGLERQCQLWQSRKTVTRENRV